MNAIALPNRNILTPRLDFPRWLRLPRGGRDERVARMLAPLGGTLTPLGVSGVAATNWWEAGGASGAIAAYQPKGAASLAASYVNLANPGTYNAAPGTAPTLGAGGWTFNGTSQYLTTGITPSSYAAKSMLIRITNATATGDRVPIGAYLSAGGNNSWYFDIYYAGNSIYWDATHFTSGTITSGTLGVSGTTAYINGSARVVTITAQNPTNQLYIGALNIDGGLYGYFGGDIVAVAIYNINLTGTQMSAVSAAMAAL